MELALVAVGLLSLVALRHAAVRRLRPGDTRSLWLVFVPALVMAGLPLLAAFRMYPHAPVLAILFGVAAGVFFVSLLRAVARAASAVAAGSEPDSAIGEPLGDVLTLYGALILVGAVVSVVALVALAILGELR